MSLAAKSLSILQREAVLFVSGLFSSVIVARTLGPHALGLWVILNLIPSYAEILGRVKTDAAAVYYLGRGTYQLGDVIYALHGIAVLTGGLLIVPALIWSATLAEALFGPDAEEVMGYVVVMLAQIPINFLYMNYMYLHIHREDVASLNSMVLARALGGSALTIVGILVFGAGLGGVVAGALFGLTLALIIGCWRFPHARRTGPRFNRPLLRDLLRYGGSLYVGVSISTLNNYSSQALVVAYCSPSEVAFFAVAQQFSQLINKVTDAMGVFLFPRLTRAQSEHQTREMAARAFRTAGVIVLPVAGVAALLFRPVLLALYGHPYEPVLDPFYIMLPGVAIAAVASTLVIYFQGIGRADMVAKIAVVPLFFQVILGLLLLPQMQILGAAIALSTSLAATALVQIVAFLRISGASHTDLLVGRSDVGTVKEFVWATVRSRIRIAVDWKSR